jgi:molybdate transport system substrate-binding protein
MQLWPKVESRLVLAENVRQVLDYVVTEEVEAGIVVRRTSKSSRAKPRWRPGLLSWIMIRYSIAVVKDSVNAQAAEEFVDLVQSPEGIRVLEKYDFLAPNKE